MRFRNLFAVLLFVVPQVACFGQVSVTLDDEFLFVLNGNGEEMSGLDIISNQNGLVPVGGVEGVLSASAAPFTFMLSNTTGQITYGNLGTTVKVDGSLTLSAGWDPFIADPNVQISWGDGATPRVAEFFAEPCTENCPVPTLKASLDTDRNIVLHGKGQELSGIEFRSASNSLIPATSPAPFAASPVNSPAAVQLASPGSKVTLEGDVTLGAGWNDANYSRDIEFEYQLFERETVGPFAIAKADYNYRLPRLDRLGVRVNEDDHIVLTGDSQPLQRLTIESSTASLIPASDADTGPFAAISTNTPNQVTYEAAAGSAVTLAGDVVLPTQWDWQKPKTIWVEYDLVGELSRERFGLSQSRFPDTPTPGEEPLLITLNEDNNFVLTGIGQEIGGVEFTSSTGALRTSDEETPPFPLVLSNSAERITLGVLGGVEMNGSFVLDFGPVSPDRLDEIDIEVGFGMRPIQNPVNHVCLRCGLPDVSLSQERGLMLSNFPDPVTQITFTSKNDGLLSFEPPAGVSIISATASEIIVGSAEGFDANELQGLTAMWGANSDAQVFVSFSFLDGASFGPLPISVSAAVPEPASAAMAMLGVIALLGLRSRRR